MNYNAGFFIGILVFFGILISPAPDALSIEAWRTLAVVFLMAIWWATEAIPLPATALLPLALFPLLGVFGEGVLAKDAFQEAALPYAHSNIFLFLGGFVLALAIEKVNLHKRMALTMLLMVGNNGKLLIGGFMLVSALISMWIMNTSTTLMLLPIALAVTAVIQKTDKSLEEIEFTKFQTCLLLGIAYAATIGGMSTIVGTGPNVLVVGLLLDEGIQIDFIDWMLFATPMSAIMLLVGWLILTNVIFPVDFTSNKETGNALKKMHSDLGKISKDERLVFYIFLATAFAWMFKKVLVLIPGFEGLTDYGIAILSALSLFIARSSNGGGLIEWNVTKNLPWGVLILFGGGLSMAGQIKKTGLGDWIGSFFTTFSDISPILLILLVVVIVVFLTELTSNQATTATFVPIMFGVAMGIGFDKAQVAIPVALAASCAFMLPVATPPNAIVYGSEKFTISEMMKAGFYINIIGIIVVTIFAAFVLPVVL